MDRMILNNFKNQIYFVQMSSTIRFFVVGFQDRTFSHINLKKIASAFTYENGRQGRMIESEFCALCEPSSIEHGDTRPFFYIVDRYFGNDSLEPFECIFMPPLALFTLWRYPQRGSQM